MLPESFGKTYILRIVHVYTRLFVHKFGFKPTIHYGRFGKMVKELIDSKTEMQIAALLVIFFSWHGLDGRDNFEYDKLCKAAFNPQWFLSCINQYEAYARNVLDLKLDDEAAVMLFLRQNLPQS